MPSLMFTDCSSASTLIRKDAFLPRRCIRQIRLPTTTASGRCSSTLSIRSSSSSSSPTPEFTCMVGTAEAKSIREKIKTEVSRMNDSIGVVPGLAVILVGDRKDSASYVRNTNKACESVGIKSVVVSLAEDSSEEDVLKAVLRFNDDSSVHGILVPLPLPSHINQENILTAVSIEKDVDGLNPVNIGSLFIQGVEDPLCIPCTPKGIFELLHRYNIEFQRKRVVVIGRSYTVGVPVAILFHREEGSVRIVHSKTKNPEEITLQADIIIAGAGQANMVRGSWIKPGAVVIDAGLNHVEDTNAPRGYRLVGDVCYEEACKVASAITPVPGGVGPMTIAMLLSNTLASAKRAHNFEED